MFYPSTKFEDQFEPCECCKSRYTTFTVSTGRKWTEKEIKEMIIEIANRLSYAKWYDRGKYRNELKHWSGKLSRLKEYKDEFGVRS